MYMRYVCTYLIHTTVLRNSSLYTTALTGSVLESEPMFAAPVRNKYDEDVRKNERYVKAFKKARAIAAANEAKLAHGNTNK